MFKEWVRDDHLTLTRNPNYWGKNVAYPETITFRPIPEGTSVPGRAPAAAPGAGQEPSARRT